LIQLDQKALCGLGIEKGDLTGESVSPGTLDQSGPCFLKIVESGVNIVDLKTDMIDRILMGSHNLRHVIGFLIRAIADEFNEDLSDSEEGDFVASFLILYHLAAAESKPFKSLYFIFKVIHNDSQMMDPFEHVAPPPS